MKPSRVAEAAPACDELFRSTRNHFHVAAQSLEAGNYLDDTDGYKQASDEMLIGLESLTDLSDYYLDIAGGGLRQTHTVQRR